MSPLILLLSCFSLASAWVVPNAVFHNYMSQDELGSYHFGYSGGPSSRAEHRDHFGIVRGAYNLVGANGEIQRYGYISDALGYRLTSGQEHLPVAPAPLPYVAPSLPVGPAPVEETAEVKLARENFDAEFRKAVAAKTAAAVAPAEPEAESPAAEAVIAA